MFRQRLDSGKQKRQEDPELIVRQLGSQIEINQDEFCPDGDLGLTVFHEAVFLLVSDVRVHWRICAADAAGAALWSRGREKRVAAAVFYGSGIRGSVWNSSSNMVRIN